MHYPTARGLARVIRILAGITLANSLCLIFLSLLRHQPIRWAPVTGALAAGLVIALASGWYLRRTRGHTYEPSDQVARFARRLGDHLFVRVCVWVVNVVALCWIVGGAYTLLVSASAAAEHGRPWHGLVVAGVLAAAIGWTITGALENPTLASLGGRWSIPSYRLWDVFYWLTAKITGGASWAMSAKDKAEYAAADTWEQLGELIAKWYEGSIDSQPGYAGYCDLEFDGVPDVRDIIAALNRKGLITHPIPQTGFEGTGTSGDTWLVNAAVSGFARVQDMDWLADMVATAGLSLYVCQPYRFGQHNCPVALRNGVVNTDYGVKMSEADLRHDWVGYGVCHPDVVDALVESYQVAIYDPIPGRNDRLWSALREATGLPQPVDA